MILTLAELARCGRDPVILRQLADMWESDAAEAESVGAVECEQAADARMAELRAEAERIEKERAR